MVHERAPGYEAWGCVIDFILSQEKAPSGSIGYEPSVRSEVLKGALELGKTDEAAGAGMQKIFGTFFSALFLHFPRRVHAD